MLSSNCCMRPQWHNIIYKISKTKYYKELYVCGEGIKKMTEGKVEDKVGQEQPRLSYFTQMKEAGAYNIQFTEN